ncbi:uncharacterized protein B0J16DRAFT_406176 [Fusarium flagelliforme]|uniref:uncharacterized protein n=1 Tax=Fusarium flagelliforme TaxID=2675880 RepID=UPI001E8E872F|nr:uncharacterized protein B0J16DRAFT_406176 [Fusarium flagelliforme]KAH7173808.1 hypothetical protein B0J16DRAFT_406176 [Fusarium flagelliforme]
MKFTTSLVILAAAAVYAKPVWEEPMGDEECAPIYERCLETITPYECPRRDSDCLCKAWDNMVTYLLRAMPWHDPLLDDKGKAQALLRLRIIGFWSFGVRYTHVRSLKLSAQKKAN